MLRPSGVRARLTRAVGPDESASKPGSQGWAQMPERSGTASLGAARPDAGAAATTANAAAFNIFLKFILAPKSFVKAMLHPFRRRLKPRAVTAVRLILPEEDEFRFVSLIPKSVTARNAEGW